MHQEINIVNDKYQIKASLKIPSNKESKVGIVLAHGGIINRQSLIRKKYSLGEYLCKELDAYVIAPDFLGETVHKNGISYRNFSEILTVTTKYIADTYNLTNIMGFGHSLGCFVLADSLSENEYLNTIVNYGGPIREFTGNKQSNFLSYLLNYLTSYDYSINIKHLITRIFDKETCIYLQEVMLQDDCYHSANYQFEFDSSTIRYCINILKKYLLSIKTWGKPTLLLFGTNDGVTKKTLQHYNNGLREENIQFKYITNASHVTPCMESKYQLTKLKPAITFFTEHKLKYISNSISYQQ